MKKRKKKLLKIKKRPPVSQEENSLSLHSEVIRLKKDLEEHKDTLDKVEERVQDMEIHTNLLTRLLTTLCVEKFGMRIGVLKRLIKRVEKEAIRDSQILHLEALYKLPSTDKKGPHQPPSKNDPWEEIS